MIDPEQVKQLNDQFGYTPPAIGETDTRASSLESKWAEADKQQGIKNIQADDQKSADTYNPILPARMSDLSSHSLPVSEAISVGKMALNTPSSLYGMGKGIVNAVTNPAKTVEGVANAVSGVLQESAGGYKSMITGQAPEPINNPATQTFDSLVGAMKDRYGSPENLYRTMVNDPAGFATDLAVLIGGGASMAGKTEELGNVINKTGETVSGITGNLAKATRDEIASRVPSKVTEGMNTVKEAIKPTLTPEEATGQIIQGKPQDIATAQRTLKSLPNVGEQTYKDLQVNIKSQIKPLAEKVDAELMKDPTARPISSFEKTIGTGANTTKINYVREAIDNLKELYQNTSDAKGLSDIKTLETKVDGLRGIDGRIINNATGLTNKEVNDLSRTYNSEFGSKAFSKVSGDPLTSVNAQKFENIRMGLKDTARQGLGGKEAQALDAKLSDLYDTQKLIDKQVTKVNATAQKTPKVGIIPKTVGKIVKTADILTGSPLKSIGKVMGTAGSSGALSPVEIEANLAKNLKILRGE